MTVADRLGPTIFERSRPGRGGGKVPHPPKDALSRIPAGNLREFIIPAIVLGMSGVGSNMRLMRTMMLEVLRQDYVRTAWAKGLKERAVVMRHTLKNALIPVVTMAGGQTRAGPMSPPGMGGASASGSPGCMR